MIQFEELRLQLIDKKEKLDSLKVSLGLDNKPKHK